MTQNNVQGMVQQGVQVPSRPRLTTLSLFSMKMPRCRCRVTPQVTDDNNIFLIINVNNASLGAAVSQAGPSINTQQATTRCWFLTAARWFSAALR